MSKLEFDYYKRYSKSRYQMVHLTHLTPFVKRQYFTGGKGAKLERDTELSLFLEQITANTLQINRFDILSRYQDHNHSPSTRNMHSCQLLFVIDAQVYFYDLYEDRLYLASSQKLKGFWAQDKMYVIGCSDLLNISRYYSEFSLYLSILDAGHVLCNVKNTLNTLKAAYSTYDSFNACDVFDRLSIPSDSIYGSFMLELNRPSGSLVSEDTIRSNRISTLKSFDELQPTEFVSRLLRSFQTAQTGRCVPVHPEFVLPYNKLRNSAHTMVGNFNLSESFADFDPEWARDLLNQVKRSLTNPDISFCILEKERVWLDSGEIKEIEVDFGKILYNDHQFFDLQTYNKVVVCYSHDRQIVNRGLISTVISAGELMQAACLYSADRGYAFRPMKNHNDDYLKQILRLDSNWEINYIGVLCNSEISPLRYAL